MTAPQFYHHHFVIKSTLRTVKRKTSRDDTPAHRIICIYLYKTKNNSMVLKFARTHNNKSKIIDRCDKMKNMLDNKEWDSFNGRTARSYLDS